MYIKTKNSIDILNRFQCPAVVIFSYFHFQLGTEENFECPLTMFYIKLDTPSFHAFNIIKCKAQVGPLI